MPKNKTARNRVAPISDEPVHWTARIAPDIRRVGVNRWLTRWSVVIAIAMAHVWALTWLATNTDSEMVFYAAAAAPIVLTTVLRPQQSLYRWYRWPAVIVLALSSAAGPTMLVLAEAWALAAFFAPAELAARQYPIGTPIAPRPATIAPKTSKPGQPAGAPVLTGLWDRSQALAGKMLGSAR